MEAAHAQRLRIRLFLEGIEVPVIAAQVQCSPNSPAVATIQIPPLAEASRLLPRTTVHLFFLDLYEEPTFLSGDRRQNDQVRSPTEADRDARRLNQGVDENELEGIATADANQSKWKLLFGGELVGFTWNKSQADRSVILQCEDWSNYWDYAYQANNTDIFGPGMKAVFSGASTNLFTDFLESEGEVLVKILVSGRCNTFPALKGLAAGVIRLLEAVGGSYYVFPGGNKNQPPKRVAGQNVFFSYNELRLHLTQLIGTPTGDTTSESIMRYQGYSGMFSRALGGQGGQVSIRQAVGAISQVIFYEMFPQSCPKYLPGSFGSIRETKKVLLLDHPDYGKYASTSNDIAAGLGSMLATIDSVAATTDPKLYSTNAKQLGKDLVRELASARRSLLRLSSQMRKVPEPVPSLISTSAQLLGKAITQAQGLAGASDFLSETKAPSTSTRLSKVKDYLGSAMDKLTEVSTLSITVNTGSEKYPAQLFQQVFRPDVWFAAPPRCNVLFPELYNTLSYQRVFLQEPTRFMLKTNDEFFGEDELFDHFYFSPTAGTLGGQKANLQKMLRSQLMQHERFTGILPVFEKMGEFNVFASRAEHRVGIKKVGLAQRTANFLYFRHRFNARRMSVSGKFNPYVAVGAPALVIDKYVDRETIARHNELRKQQMVPEVEMAQLLGTNFLGNMTQVVHTISQQGPSGSTEIQMTFARQAEENVDYLGSLPDDAKVQRRVEGGDAVRSTTIAALDPPPLYSLGPNGGRVTNVVDITDSKVGSTLPFFYSGFRRQSTFRPPVVPVGVQTRAGDLNNNELASLLGGPDKLVTFGAYTVTEEIPRYRLENATLPAEEFVRPGWYGKIWTNSEVGAVWNELFSTGAITDPQTVNDYGRNANQSHLIRDNPDAAGPEDPNADAPAVADLQAGASIQQAAEFLQLTYSYIKQAGLDVNEFIGSYTWRPIATLTDMFGSYDLTYDTSGENVIQGYEGFHSRAVGPYDNLFGLVTPEIETVLNIKRGSPESKNIDVRKERRAVVERYITELLFGNALLG